MANGQFTINNDDNHRVLCWGKGTVNDEGVAVVNAVIVHAITFDLYKKGCGRVLDEMLIKAKVCGSADDCEHWAMVSCGINDGLALWVSLDTGLTRSGKERE